MGGLTYSLYNSNKFDFIAGVDIDSTAIEMANEYQNIKNIPNDNLHMSIAEIYNLSFDDNTFDFIIMKDIGEHLENKSNLQKALQELNRVLKKDGYIFIETPNYLFPMEVH
jgi:ubiquinone/menaquinone biosynthesis C-methylase UbiE